MDLPRVLNSCLLFDVGQRILYYTFETEYHLWHHLLCPLWLQDNSKLLNYCKAMCGAAQKERNELTQ